MLREHNPPGPEAEGEVTKLSGGVREVLCRPPWLLDIARRFPHTPPPSHASTQPRSRTYLAHASQDVCAALRCQEPEGFFIPKEGIRR